MPSNSYGANHTRVGHTLSVDPGPAAPVDATLAYQWNTDGNPIGGATGPTYQLTTAQAGQTITVAVSAAAPGLSSHTETSDPTTMVDIADTTPETPTDPGTAAPSDAALPDTGGVRQTILALGMTSILAGALTLVTDTTPPPTPPLRGPNLLSSSVNEVMWAELTS